MLSLTANRFLSLVMALILLFSLLPVKVFATEENAATEQSIEGEIISPPEETTVSTAESTDTTLDNTEAIEPEKKERVNLQEIQQKIDVILLHYLGNAHASEEQIRNIVAEMDREACQMAKQDIAVMEESSNLQHLSEGERTTLILENATLFAFYHAIEEKINTDYSISVLAESTVTVLDGKISITDTLGNGTVSNGVVTVTAQGGRSSKIKTNTVKITNSTDSTATITFTYAASNYYAWGDGFSLSKDTDTLSYVLTAGEIREVMWIKGPYDWGGSSATLTLSNFTYEVASASSNVTFNYDSTLGSITVAGTAVSAGSDVDVPSTGGTDLVATPKSGASFLGWVYEADGKIVSTSASHSGFVTSKATTVKAIFVSNTNGNACFRVGNTTDGYLFEDLNDAADCATSTGNSKIVLVNNGSVPSGNYAIPSEKTLLIPFDSAETVYTTEPGKVYNENKHTTPYVYRTLTMAAGAHITVNGSMSVPSKIFAAHSPTQNAGAPDGAYGCVNMSSGSSITVNGSLYAYGYIIGSGSVIANNGATVYECFQINDFRGGDDTTSMTNGVFPISQYYVQNIEVPLTIYKGATIKAYTAIHVNLLGMQGSAINFIGTSDAMFNLAEGYLITSYDGSRDRLNIELHGNINISSITLAIGMYSVDSAKYNMALNSNISVNICSGSSLSINQNIALLPGCEVVIEQGSTVTLAEGKSFYVYDKDQWGGYAGTYNQKLIPINYAPGKKYTRTEADLVDAVIQVDGTFDTSAGYLYTTSSGANICSTGSGIVKTTPGDTTTTYQYQPEKYISISVTPAKLKNADGKTPAYTETAAYGAGTYKYINGKWYKTFDIVASNLAVNDGLDMWFYVKYEDVAGITSNYNAVVTKEFADDRSPNPITETISGTKWVAYDQNNDGTFDYYRFKFSDISAKEMTDQLTAVVLHTDNIQVSNTYEQTVQNYAITMLDHYKSTTGDGKIECLKKALMDMLEYGASAQAQFKNYNIENLANVAPSGVTTLTDHSGYITTTTPTCESKKVYDDGVAGVTVSATNTLLFTFYFNVSDTTGMYAEIKYTPHGETAEQTVTVNAEDFYERVAGSLYGVDVKGLSVVDGRQVMTCTLYDNTGKAIATATDSIEGYAYRNAENGDIFMDMMRFVDSALAYFDYAA